MSFKSVACQERIVELFQNAIRNNHLAHAYIFAGQEGVGKTSFSRELAKTIFCKHPGRDACDTCNNCQRITRDNFSDLFFILPERNSPVKVPNHKVFPFISSRRKKYPHKPL